MEKLIEKDCKSVLGNTDLAKEYTSASYSARKAINDLYSRIDTQDPVLRKLCIESITGTKGFWDVMDPAVKQKLEALDMEYCPESRVLLAGEILRIYG